MFNFIRRMACAMAIISLVGCAATVTQTELPASQQPGSSRSAPAGSLLVMRITGSAAAQASADWSRFVDDWKASMTTAATEAKMVCVVAASDEAIPAQPGTLVRIKVNNFRYMSQGARFMVGILAGNASMDVEAEYLELPSRAATGSKKFNTSTSASQGIFSAATPKQVEAVAAVIVKDIRGEGGKP